MTGHFREAGPDVAAAAAAQEASDTNPDQIRARMSAQVRDVLFARATAVVWVVLAGISLFSLAKFWYEPATTILWYGPALALALLQAVVLGVVPRQASMASLEKVMLADLAATCAVIAWLGVASGRTTGAGFFLLGVAINTAAILPWAPRCQRILAAVAGLGILANGYGVHGSLADAVDFRTFVPALILLGASVYTSRMLESARLRSARADLLRERAEVETLQLNAQLERRVAERTAELQAANDELEAFAYSVSHDLRAPLRAMDGLSEALLEDYAGDLDANAKDYLRRIRGEARRLGDLIDDLLQLSRVTRSVIRRGPVDMSALAREVAVNLQETEPEREVRFSIASGLRDHCDATLVRVLLENLIGNAFKFTRTRPEASIEFGAENNGEARVYVVRDNGVGFDMAHVGKIFGVFERLHTIEEFEGTGIGLTTAERIVHRHGGMLSAEAQRDRGATFRFTLSPGGGAQP